MSLLTDRTAVIYGAGGGIGAGVAETFGRGREGGADAAEADRLIGGMSALRRAPRLQEVADAAAFLASRKAGATTASVTNVTCGLVSQR